MKIASFPAKSVKLILDNDIEELAAEASISLNKNLTWIKLVLADDVYNENRQRIPREEFVNVIKTGIFMPIKMAEGSIAEGHEDARPLGTMSHIKTNGNTIEALAAVWQKERPEDVEYLKGRYANNEPIDFSWELTYKDSIVDDDGETLTGVSMNAATIVGRPAYAGRTPAIAIASAEEGEQMDTIPLEQHTQEIENLKKEYEDKLLALQASIDEQKAALAELDELKQFKADADAIAEKETKLKTIKQKFTEANVNVPEDYIDARAETLLTMSEDQLNFFIQELVSSLTKAEEGQASISLTSKEIPAMNGGGGDKIEKENLVGYLRSLDRKGDN